MSLHKRLERLEASAGASVPPQRSRAMERLLHAFENARREMEGLALLPDTPYSDEELREALEVISVYRAEPGYQSGEGRHFLDRWEQATRQKLAKGATE
jgi:hypothetical protein